MMECKRRNPVDTGWSWIVLTANFLAICVTAGLTYSLGVYYWEFLHVFNASKGATSLISGLNYGMLCGLGPVYSFCIHHWGNRVTMFLGTVTAASGLIICAFAEDIYTTILTLGVIHGIGSGMVYCAAICATSLYFDHYRPFAFGISMAGGGLGNIVVSWLSVSLIESFGWRSALLFTSGFTLQGCICAMLIFPQSKIKEPMQNGDVKYNSEKDAITATEGDKHGFMKMTIEVCRNPAFLVLLLGTFFFLNGVGVVYTHLFAYVEYQNLPPEIGSLMVSVLGLMSVIGRIGLGSIGQHPSTDIIILYAVAIAITGLATVAMAFLTNLIGLLICTTIFGFFVAAFSAPANMSTHVLVGQAHFHIGYGFLASAMGFGWSTGAPLAGWIHDLTQNYEYSFYLGGSITIFGALLIIPARYLHRLQGRKIQREPGQGNKMKEKC